MRVITYAGMYAYGRLPHLHISLRYGALERFTLVSGFTAERARIKRKRLKP